MINIINKVQCCGCNACGDICPKNAITFETDIEGFWYPKVDRDKCIDCGLCERTCPIANVNNIKKSDFEQPQCIAAINKNLEVRFDSTSGGMFSALAEQTYKIGGYVVACEYTEDWGVRWAVSHNREDLPKLRSSKYLQSDSTGMYKEIQRLLKEAEQVLFCGLPCQAAALRAFLNNKEYDNLIIADLICRYINSPLAYRKYLDTLEKEYGSKVVYIKAKNKEFGWKKLTHKVVFENESTYYGTIDNDIFMKASMKLNCVSRPSCYECRFKTFPRYGDITIGDYWTRGKMSVLDDNTGTSVVLLNSKKGEKFFNLITKRLRTEEVTFDSVLRGNMALLQSLPQPNMDRTAFFKRIQEEDFRSVVDDFAAKCKMNPKDRLKAFLKGGKNYLRILGKVTSYTRCRPRALFQFFYLNFFHPAIRRSVNFSREKVLYVTPHCLFEIDKKAKIELGGPLVFGASVFKRSKLETRIRMQSGARLITYGPYGFGYGSDIEIFKNATVISKGGPRTNMGTTLICQNKIIIGEEVAIGRDVTIRDNNGGHLISVNGYQDSRPVIIGEHVWLCSGCTIMAGVKIGDGTIISANTFVNKSFPARCVVSSEPARITNHNIYWKI